MVDEDRWKYKTVMQSHSNIVYINIESTYIYTQKSLEEPTYSREWAYEYIFN